MCGCADASPAKAVRLHLAIEENIGFKNSHIRKSANQLN